MTERYISYGLGGEMYDVPESESATFEERNPSATIEMRIGKDVFDVPLSEKENFLKVNGDSVSYLYEDENPETKNKKDDKTSVFETIGKGIGAAGVGTAKLALDLGQNLWQQTLGRLDDQTLDEVIHDESNPVTRASMRLGEIQERLSREADPTGGEVGFGQLLKEGKIGLAAQKALGSGLESLPMMVAAGTGWGALLYGTAMAAGQYADETRENDDIPAWKRGVNSIGSAVLEMAVEKIGGPLKNLGGKAGKEFSEEMAKEIMEEFAKEGTQRVAKRIFNTLKKPLKEGLEEGGEELLTSFGNDALGSALDMIDGDKDYGIHAQWERMKEENPDADLGDFAKSKANEYLDAFLGGALSGMEIAGTTDAIRLGVSNSQKNQVQHAKTIGSGLGLQDMYDVDHQIVDSGNEVEKAFLDGEGNSMLSRDFIDGLTSVEAYELSRNEDFTPYQRKALLWHAKSKAVQEGLTEKIDAELNNKINTQNILINEAQSDGVVVTGFYNGQPVYVKGAVANNGSVSLPNGENGPVMVINQMTGEKTTVRTEDIKMSDSVTANEYRARIESQLRNNDAHNREMWRNRMSFSAKFRDIQQYAGSKITINSSNGLTEVEVLNINPETGKVLIKGKKGDLGQSELQLDADLFYDSIARNEDGTPVYVEKLPQKEQAPENQVAETTSEPQPEQPVISEGPQDFREYVGPMVINGVPVNVEVTQQDDTVDRVYYTFVDENGVRRSGSTTVAGFAEAVQQAGQLQTEVPVVDTPPTENVPTENVAPEPAPAEVPPTTETPVPQNITLKPEDIDWDALFDTDQEAFFAEMQNQFGDKSERYFKAFLAAAQNELEKLEKSNPTQLKDIVANEARKDALQARIDTLNEMVSRLTAVPAPDVVPTTPAAPADETPEVEAPTTPEVPTEPVSETPAPESPSVPETEVPTTPVGEAPAAPEATAPEVSTTPEPEVTPEPQPEPAPVPEAPTSQPTPQATSTAKQAGGTLGRMVKEAKANIDKIIKKASVADFVGTDKTRPAMTGVFRAGGYEYASDSKMLAKIRVSYPSEQEGKIISPKTGQEVAEKFPNADIVVESALNSNKPTSFSLDDIIAYAYVMEEVKKRLEKGQKLYVKVGNDIFDSELLLTAAKLAKKHGLNDISQNETIGKAMAFNGNDGTILVMPMNGKIPTDNIIDISNGSASFNFYHSRFIKMPTSLKGIDAARRVLETIIPNVNEDTLSFFKRENIIQLVDGKVVFNFYHDDVANAKRAAKDPNTYNALEDIEKNGLEIPLSTSEITRLFPEEVAAPVAPTIVDNPSNVAQEEEKKLQALLRRNDLNRNEKRDWAYKYGKKVADMFATQEEYEEYEDSLGADLGSYYPDFKRGVEESFANRPKNSGNSQENGVSLGTEPSGGNNGTEAGTETPEGTEGYNGTTGGQHTYDEGGEEGTQEAEVLRGGDTNQEIKYPARNGDATRQLLMDTFGFVSVSPGISQENLNHIYDFLMEMAKMLGISPTSISHGATLGMGVLGGRSSSTLARYEYRSTWDGTIREPYIRFKNSLLSSIAHEWWHSLDQVLSYYETGRGKKPATTISANEFTGRPEVLDAIREVLNAINKSGHKARLDTEYKDNPDYLAYSKRKKELAARFFEGYIKTKFAEAGIVVNGFAQNQTNTPTAEELKPVIPAFNNLFNVLKEKEGKKEGSTVLYHIGHEVDEAIESEQFTDEAIDLTNAVIDMSLEGVVDVERASDEQTKEVLALGGIDNQFRVETDKPIFISNAALAVQGIKMEKATPEQWLKMIEKAGGLKAGEDKWMGLSDWLKASDKKTLTKQEVLDYIHENEIQIEEVNYVAQIELEEEEQKQLDAMNEEFLALRKEAQDAGEWIADAGEIAYQLMADKYGDDFTIGFGVDNGELYVSNLEAAASITGIEPRSEREINDTRLRYTTEGLDNKKEIAIIIPTIDKWNQYDEIHFGDAGDGRAVAWVRFGDAKKVVSFNEPIVVEEFKEPYKNHRGWDVYKPVNDDVGTGDYITAGTMKDTGRFVYATFINDKVIGFYETLNEAKSAMNQHYAENPKKKFTKKKILVIDEIQSKRHQEGREHGYKSPRPTKETERLKALNAKMSELREQQAHINDEIAREKENEDIELARIDAWLDDVMNIGQYNELTRMRENIERKRSMREDALYVIKNEIMLTQSAIWDEEGKISRAEIQWIEDNKEKVADAPFDKNWHELAMKRMLRYAAENGYDAVAWTKGEQQAERYDIGGVVSEISVKHAGSSGYEVESFNGSGYSVLYGVYPDVSAIAEVYGKELAEKITNSVSSYGDKATIDGNNLVVGGEGMKGFYDKMLPSFMNKYGKKWGVKVEEIKLNGLEDGEVYMHSVPVNEAMKDSVMEGQPMFFKTPNGIVYGWTDGKKIYLTKAGMNPNTKIHEYTHLWAKAMMQKNPKGWNSIKQLLKNTPVWNEVMNDANYSNIHGNDDMVASEVLSRISGTENAVKLEQMAQKMIDEAKGTMRKAEARGLIQNIKDALNKFWNWVGTELFKIEKFESIDEITDRVLWDLVNKTDLGTLFDGQIEAQINDTQKKRSVEKNFGGLWIANKQEYAKFASAVNQYVFEKNGQGIAYTDNHFYAYYWNINGEPIPYIDVYLNANESQDVVNQINEEYGVNGNQGIGVYIDRAIERARNIKDRRNDSTRINESTSSSRGDDIVGGYISRKGKYADKPSLYVTSVRPDGKTNGLNDITSVQNENTEDTHIANDSRGASSETGGVQEKESVSASLGDSRRLYNPEGEGVSWDDYTSFNPINEREGESDRQRNLRETQFFETFEKLTSDERLMLYAFLSEYLPKNSGALKSKTEKFIEPIRTSGNTGLVDFIENFVNDELKYREGVSASAVAKHGLFVGASYNPSVLAQIFAAYNNDTYNEELFNRALQLAKRFGVTIKFATRADNGDFINEYGSYNPTDNSITLDANLLTKGNESELCQTIVHELIHGVVARATSIMSGRAVNKNNEFIDPQSLPKDVIDGINTLKEVYDAIKDDESFQNTYGVTSAEEMLSEITDPKFRGLLKAKNLWKKFLNGICKVLGIKDTSATESDALTEVESALDKIFQSAERGELDNLYAGYLGQLAEGYTLEDLQNLGSGPVKSLLTQNKLFKTGIDPTQVAATSARQVYDRVVSDNWNEFQRQFQDAFQPVRIAIDAIQKETGNIPIEDYENFLLIQNQMSSRSRVEIDNFSRRYYTPIIKQVNAIIDKIMESRGLIKRDKDARAEIYKEVRQYLIAKHGLERNKYYQEHKTRIMKAKEMKPLLDEAEKDYQTEVNMINMNNNLTEAERELQLRDALDVYNATVQEIKTREVPDLRDYSGLTSLFGLDSKEWKQAEEIAQELVDDFENSLGRENNEDGEMITQSEEIDALWNRINAATNKTLRHSYESGMLSRQQYNEIKEMFKFYIPLRGFDETTAEDVYSYARFEGNRFNAAVHKAEGRTSVADDPIAIIMNMAESEIAQGNKNRAKQALYNYLLNRAGAMNEQNSLMQLEDVWYLVDVDEDGNKTYQIVTPDHASGETYEEFDNKMQALSEEGMAEKSRKGKLDIGYRFQKQYNKNAHYVFVKINGVEKAIYINGDPKAADAINGRYQKELGAGIKFFRDIQRVISSTFTNYSLEFTARNYFRDMIYSHINIGVRESNPAYRKNFRKNWRHNNMGAMMRMLKAYRAGEYDGRALTEDEAAFVEFMNNGGQTGYTLINSVENHKKDLQRAIERMQNGIEKGGVKDSTIFKATLGSIELLNEASELVTRFAAFKTSRDMGRGINTSIKDAKEVTVNFNTKGAQDGQGWMGAIARYFGWCKYFFNASIQGVQNIKSMRDANKLKFGTVVGGVVATGFFMPILVSAVSELLGGDDEEEYWNIPEYERQNNFCIPLGNGKYVKIPLPIGFREVYAIGDMVAASLMDKRFNRNVGEVGMDIANKIASVVLPVNPLESMSTGLNMWQTFLYTGLPSSAQVLIQNATNTDWKGTPLQKEYTYNENDPKWMKAFASNPDWMTGLSKWCNEHINLDGDYKGMDWSPEKLENTLSNLGGGIYSLIKKSGKTLSMIWNEENRNLSNVPLAGVVLGSSIDSDDAFVTDVYFEMKDFYDANLNYIKRRAEQFGYDLEDVFEKEKGKHHPKMHDIYGNDNFDFMQEWYKGNKELEEMNREIKKLNNEIAAKKNPTTALINKLAKKQDKFNAERRDFVNDMLELD